MRFKLLNMNFTARVNRRSNRLDIVNCKGTVEASYPADVKLCALSPHEQQEFANQCFINFKAGLLRQVTPEFIQDRVQEFNQRLLPSLHVLEGSCASRFQDHSGVVLSSIARQTINNLERLEKATQQDLPLMAWPGRNFYELYLWAYFAVHMNGVYEPDDGLMAKAYRDQDEIMEGFFRMLPNAPDQLKEKREENRQKNLENAKLDKVTVSKKPPNTKQLAERIDLHRNDPDCQVTRDYYGFFKLTSKYLHPSPFLFLGLPTEQQLLMYRQAIALKAMEYAEKIRQVLRDGAKR